MDKNVSVSSVLFVVCMCFPLMFDSCNCNKDYIYNYIYNYIYMFEAEMLDGFGLPELDFGLLDCSCINNYTHKLAEGEQNMRTHT